LLGSNEDLVKQGFDADEILQAYNMSLKKKDAKEEKSAD
jgi:hypothetical protein